MADYTKDRCSGTHFRGDELAVMKVGKQGHPDPVECGGQSAQENSLTVDDARLEA